MIRKLLILTLIFSTNISVEGQVQVPDSYVPEKVMNMNLASQPHEVLVYDTNQLNKITTQFNLSIAISSLDTSGLTDVSDTLNYYLDKAYNFKFPDSHSNRFVVSVLLPPGTFKLSKPILMKSNVLLKGSGMDETHFVCDVGEGKHCFVFSPVNMGLSMVPFDTLSLKENVSKRSKNLKVNHLDFDKYAQLSDTTYLAGLVNQSDSGLVSNTWAKGTVKELFTIGTSNVFKNDSFYSLDNTPAVLNFYGTVLGNFLNPKPFVLSYPKSTSRVYLYHSIKNSGLQCLSIERLDTTVSQTSNIIFTNAQACHVMAVRSKQCNFGHITLNNSCFNLIKRCIISNGNNYGGGGKAYGVVLQQSSSNNTVVDNVLHHLRHSILLQSGANNNIVLANYSFDPYWEGVSLPSDAAGDIVLHGNYPFGNLFEANVAQQIVIDDSHGKNGPHNIFHRNWLQNYGIFMSAANGSDSQVFTGNEITNRGFLKGQYSLKDGGHFQHGNKQGDLIIPVGTPTALVKYVHKGWYLYSPRRVIVPEPSSFLNADSVAFGEPFNQPSKLIPALERGITTPNCFEWDDYFLAYSVKTLSKEGSFIYPNPSEGWIKSKQEGMLTLYDLQGRKVFEQEVNDNTDIQVNLKGLFIAHLQTKEGIVTQKLRMID